MGNSEDVAHGKKCTGEYNGHPLSTTIQGPRIAGLQVTSVESFLGESDQHYLVEKVFKQVRGAHCPDEGGRRPPPPSPGHDVNGKDHCRAEGSDPPSPQAIPENGNQVAVPG